MKKLLLFVFLLAVPPEAFARKVWFWTGVGGSVKRSSVPAAFQVACYEGQVDFGKKIGVSFVFTGESSFNLGVIIPFDYWGKIKNLEVRGDFGSINVRSLVFMLTGLRRLDIDLSGDYPLQMVFERLDDPGAGDSPYRLSLERGPLSVVYSVAGAAAEGATPDVDVITNSGVFNLFSLAKAGKEAEFVERSHKFENIKKLVIDGKGESGVDYEYLNRLAVAFPAITSLDLSGAKLDLSRSESIDVPAGMPEGRRPQFSRLKTLILRSFDTELLLNGEVVRELFPDLGTLKYYFAGELGDEKEASLEAVLSVFGREFALDVISAEGLSIRASFERLKSKGSLRRKNIHLRGVSRK